MGVGWLLASPSNPSDLESPLVTSPICPHTPIPILLLLLVLASPAATAASAQAPEAYRLVEAAHRLMGGSRLDSLRAVRLTGSATDDLVGISSAQAPPVEMHRTFVETRDVRRLRLRRNSVVSLPMRPDSIAFAEVVDTVSVIQVAGGRPGAGSPSQWQENVPWLRYGIERVLPEALRHADLRLGVDTVIAGHAVRSVTFESARVRLYLDRSTMLPVATAVEQEFSDDPTWGPWGRLTTLVVYGDWSWQAGGLRYPMSTTTYRLGRPIRHVIVRRLELDPDVPDSLFPFTPELRQAYTARGQVVLGTPSDTIQWIAEGVLWIPGPFSVFLVRQGRDFAIIGTPHSDRYMRLVVDEAMRRFPGGQPRLAVVGSATWPHLAGVGTLIDRGVEIAASPGTAGVIRQIAQRRARSARLTEVREPLAIGTGAGRIRLLPNQGPGAVHDDQLVTWIEADQLVLASDLLRPERFEPNLWRQPMAELLGLIAAHRLAPIAVAALHVPLTRWEDAVAPLSLAADAP